MSELTPCNFCSLLRLRLYAERDGVPSGEPLAGWISLRRSDQNQPSSYFMELPDRCAC